MRLIIVAELAALQMECKHPNQSTRRCGDYSGDVWSETVCEDCGEKW